MRAKLLLVSLLFAFSVALSGAQAPSRGNDKRAPVPGAPAQEKAEKLIKGLFQEEYAKRDSADLLALSAELLKQGMETNDDPAARFVLFREAADLAAQAGDLDAAFRVIDVLVREYIVDRVNARVAAVATAAGAVKTETAHKAVAATGLKLVDEAIAADNYEAGLRVLEVALAAAEKSKNVPLATRVQNRGEELREIQKEWEGVQAARAKLKEKADDAEANLRVGKFLCLRKDAWDDGLPLLARGSDAKLKALAEKELARPTAADKQILLGDGWWEMGEAERGTTKKLLQKHACHWYGQARPKLSGLTKTKVDKKILSLTSAFYLTDMKELEVKQGPWPLGKNGEVGNPQKSKIVVKGKESPKGLGLHVAEGYSAVKYKLGANAHLFKAAVAIDDSGESSRTGPVVFEVRGDGKSLWQSKPIHASGQVEDCSVDVTGVDVLELRINLKGSGYGAHTVWVEPHVLKNED